MDIDKDARASILAGIPTGSVKKYKKKERTEREKYNSLSRKQKIALKREEKQEK